MNITKSPIQSIITALALVALVGGINTHAQDFAIPWFTIDGGGGTSHGGAYRLSGTIGQPDAGQMAGGPFVLGGGFWQPEAPACDCALTIVRTGHDLVLTWTEGCAGCVLESSTELRGREGRTEWAPVTPPPTSSPYITSATGPHRFFRFRCP